MISVSFAGCSVHTSSDTTAGIVIPLEYLLDTPLAEA